MSRMLSDFWNELTYEKQQLLLSFSFFHSFINWKSFSWFLEELSQFLSYQDIHLKNFEDLKNEMLAWGVIAEASVAEEFDLQIFQIHPLLREFLQNKLIHEERTQIGSAFANYYQRVSRSLFNQTYSQKDDKKRREMTQLLQFEVENIRNALTMMYEKKESVLFTWGCVQFFYTQDRRYEEALSFTQEVLRNLEEHGYKKTEMEYIQAKYNIATIYVWMHQFVKAEEILIDVEKLLDKTNEKEDNPKSIADLYQAIGTIFKQTMQYDKSLPIYEKAMNLYQQIDSKNGLLGIHIALGDVMLGLRDFNSSFTHYKTAMNLAEEMNDNVNLALVKHDLGRLYDSTSNHALADKEMKEALGLYEKLEDPRNIAETLSNLGANANRWGNFELSKDYYKRAIPYFIELDDNERLGILYSNLGTIEMYAKNNEDAGIYYERAIDIFKNYTDRNGKYLQASALQNRGLVSYLMNKLKEGNTYLLKALTLYLELNDRDTIHQLLTNMLYMAQQMKQTDSSESASEELGRSLGLANEELARSLKAFREAKNYSVIGCASYNLGFLRYHLHRLDLLKYSLDRTENSKQYFLQAIEAYQTIGDGTGYGLVSSILGKLEGVKKNYEDAKTHLKNALESLAKHRDQLNLLQIIKYVESLRETDEFGYVSFRNEMVNILNQHFTEDEITSLFEKSLNASTFDSPVIQL